VILDTNALAAWREGDSTIVPVIGRAAFLALPVIVFGEYRYGATKSTERPLIENWLDRVTRTIRILSVTLDTAEEYASLRSALDRRGRPIPPNDMWIAALALQHRLPILSRDTHFDVVDGLTRIAW
jgi:predicted nucleic acid-binding protein